ncbi:hypothetical protein EDD15DRAFT_2367099 [Pisolithus albus]|nr:hypothetical protein EDD15DRAFT_2374999 [Pisolithus albus]KAI5993978.1 hypothetical protein EDD15DRAFT_2367099 [Pisolithus albus]
MSRPITRAKNAHQHPGHIVLEGKQKRRTSEQKQADDAAAERAREEQEAAQERGIQRLADIIDNSTQEEENRLADPPRPRPRIRLILKDPSQESADTAESVMGDSDRLASDMTGMDPTDKRPSGEALADLQGSGELSVYGQEESEDELEEGLTETVQKRKRTQKTCTRDAVLAAWDKPGGSDGADRTTDRHSMDVQKRKPSSARLEADKQKFSGIGEVADWADKLASSKPLHTLLSQRSAASSRHARSISSTGTSSRIKLRGTPASTRSSTRPSTPASNNPPDSETCNDDSPYIQGNDDSERQAISNPSLRSIPRRTDTMAVTDVVSGSELDESEPSPPPPSQYSHPRKNRVSSGGRKATNTQDDYLEPSAEEMDDDVLLMETKRGTKRAPRSRGEASSTAAPPSKRMKTPRLSAGQGSQRSGSGANKKYINSDLPAGATNENAWRRLFISTLAHFAAGYDNPWTIPDDKFKHVLQEIWDVVYWGKVVYTVVIGGPVYSLAKQGLNNWRAGFAAAAVAVITTFFAHDADFDDSTTRVEFAKAMLKKNRFLFSQNRGTDNKTWTGLWRAPFILQTFAHHFNFIQGYTDVPMLNNDFSEPCTALALASAAVCRTLSLIAEGHMSFKITQPGDVLTAVIPKGGQFEFGEAVWGAVTRRYLAPIKELSHEQFGLIISETQKFVKKATFVSGEGKNSPPLPFLIVAFAVLFHI